MSAGHASSPWCVEGMGGTSNQIVRLEGALGYTFTNRALVERALTHSSVRGDSRRRSDNERLEFLGDRVLALTISQHLFTRMSEAREGELARAFNRLVRRETCAAVARDIDLGASLLLSESEADSGGRDKDTILADAMEALLAAIFLEAGFEVARDVILEHWRVYIEGSPVAATADAKSALQEWAQGQGLPLPEYSEVNRSGPDHAPLFTALVAVDGRFEATGEGASKRQAEQAAAGAMLREQGVWRDVSGER